ncbi:lipopolysaccharide biosynthesis protein [Halosimplex amylolyticum]|uniref:lipopolysaccharide biosynthesis protein n=1 Tax=Halosimplex amylolyticum TaxID=3396616 RepID=UPI003F56EC76
MDFRKILTDSGVAMSRNVLTMVRGVIVVPIITKLMGVGAYGVWTLLITSISFVSAIGGLHLHGALIRYTPNEERRGQTVSDLLVLSVVSSVVSALVLYFGLQLASLSIPDQSIFGADLLTIAALLVTIETVGILLKNVPRSEDRIKTYELILLADIAIKTASLVVALVLVETITAGLLAILLSTTFVHLSIAALYVPKRLRKPNGGNLKRYLSYCTPMVANELSSKLLAKSDRFIIIYFLDPVALGIYSVAYGVSIIFPKFANAFNSTLYPSITSAWENDEIGEIERFYNNFLTGFVLLAVPLLFGIALLADPILRLLATEKVAREGWFLVPIITAAFLFRGYESTLVYVLNALEENEIVAKGTTVALILNVVINVALLPVIGLLGAAVAMVVSMAARLVYVYFYVGQHISIDVPQVRIGKAVLSSLVMTGVLLYVVNVPNTRMLRLVIYPIVGVLVYFSVVYLVGGIKRRDIHQIISLLQNGDTSPARDSQRSE